MTDHIIEVDSKNFVEKVIKGSELDLVDRESYSRGQQAIDYVGRVKEYYQLMSAHSCVQPKDQLIFF